MEQPTFFVFLESWLFSFLYLQLVIHSRAHAHNYTDEQTSVSSFFYGAAVRSFCHVVDGDVYFPRLLPFGLTERQLVRRPSGRSLYEVECWASGYVTTSSKSFLFFGRWYGDVGLERKLARLHICDLSKLSRCTKAHRINLFVSSGIGVATWRNLDEPAVCGRRRLLSAFGCGPPGI